MVTLTLSSPCGLSDGSYWIEVFDNTGIGFDDWFWEFGTVDPAYGLPNAAFARETPGVAWEGITVSPFNETAVQLDSSLGTVACVDSAADLQAALTVAALNNAEDVIQVVQGSYLTPGSEFTYSTAKDFNLQLLGGFTPGCVDRAVAPANTVLDGHVDLGDYESFLAPGVPGLSGLKEFPGVVSRRDAGCCPKWGAEETAEVSNCRLHKGIFVRHEQYARSKGKANPIPDLGGGGFRVSI
jgi:hypothetical protein